MNTVLIVEDEEHLAEGLRFNLEAEGYQAEIAADGESAEVELATSDDADGYRHRAGVTLTDPRTIEATAPTWWDAWRAVYL